MLLPPESIPTQWLGTNEKAFFVGMGRGGGGGGGGGGGWGRVGGGEGDK